MTRLITCLPEVVSVRKKGIVKTNRGPLVLQILTYEGHPISSDNDPITQNLSL